jgi:hypothetical protein
MHDCGLNLKSEAAAGCLAFQRSLLRATMEGLAFPVSHLLHYENPIVDLDLVSGVSSPAMLCSHYRDIFKNSGLIVRRL